MHEKLPKNDLHLCRIISVMRCNGMDAKVKHDEKGCRFDLIVDGKTGGYITYEIYDGCLDIQHTVVNAELRGNRLGEVLLAAATDYVGKKGLKIIPTCSYAKKLLGPEKK